MDKAIEQAREADRQGSVRAEPDCSAIATRAATSRSPSISTIAPCDEIEKLEAARRRVHADERRLLPDGLDRRPHPRRRRRRTARARRPGAEVREAARRQRRLQAHAEGRAAPADRRRGRRLPPAAARPAPDADDRREHPDDRRAGAGRRVQRVQRQARRSRRHGPARPATCWRWPTGRRSTRRTWKTPTPEVRRNRVPSPIRTSPARRSSRSSPARRWQWNITRRQRSLARSRRRTTSTPYGRKSHRRARLRPARRSGTCWSSRATSACRCSASAWATHKLHDALSSFGFGQPTGIELPGEDPGLRQPARQVERSTAPNRSPGLRADGHAAAAVPAASAPTRTADGSCSRASIKGVLDADGDIVARNSKPTSSKLLPAGDRPDDGAEVRRILCDVVVRGTATKAPQRHVEHLRQDRHRAHQPRQRRLQRTKLHQQLHRRRTGGEPAARRRDDHPRARQGQRPLRRHRLGAGGVHSAETRSGVSADPRSPESSHAAAADRERVV